MIGVSEELAAEMKDGGRLSRIVDKIMIAFVITMFLTCFLFMWIGRPHDACHGQCPQDRRCQDRCFKERYCPYGR